VSGGGFSPDGTHVVTTSDDWTARIWDTATGELLLTLTGHTDGVSGGGFSPDGGQILTTSHDGTARIWDAATGNQIGWQLEQLPDGQVAVWSVPEHRLLGASPEAWRWLGWLVRTDGVVNRLPAETYGDLPPLIGR
jgi:WD40 repeat protein